MKRRWIAVVFVFTFTLASCGLASQEQVDTQRERAEKYQNQVEYLNTYIRMYDECLENAFSGSDYRPQTKMSVCRGDAADAAQVWMDDFFLPTVRGDG